MQLHKTETRLTGRWLRKDGKMKGDIITDRIEWLVANSLKRIKSDSSRWNTLFEDIDGRFWERTYE